jgi:hypothetical protein
MLTKKSLEEEIIGHHWETHGDTVNLKVQDALKKFQDTINRKLEQTQKQLNELREDFNKHLSETETNKKKTYAICL